MLNGRINSLGDHQIFSQASCFTDLFSGKFLVTKAIHGYQTY